MEVGGADGDIHEIGLTAARVRRFAEALSQGHSFGITPGPELEPWSLDFQRSAISVYTDTISWDYLISLAKSFSRRASIMGELKVPDHLTGSWSILSDYLTSASTAILEAVPHDHQRAWPLPSLGHVTPPVMPFERLAALIHSDGAADLTLAALDVEMACLQGAGSPSANRSLDD